MPTDRIVYKHHFIVMKKIVHTGITPDLEGSKHLHRKTPGWDSGHILQVGSRTTHIAALEWEREQSRQGKPVRPLRNERQDSESRHAH